MKRMGYSLNRGNCLNFGKKWGIPLQLFVKEGKPTNYCDLTRKGLGYLTPSPQIESESDKSLPSWSSDLSSWNFDISLGVVFKKLFANMTSIGQAEQEKTSSRSILICGLNC